MNRTIVVGARESGRTLEAVVKSGLGVSWTQARHLIARRLVRVDGQACGDRLLRLKKGQRLECLPADPPARGGKAKDPKSRAEPRPQKSPQVRPRVPAELLLLVHCDDSVIVVDKPPGVTTHRSAEESAEFGSRGQRFLPKTLADRVRALVGGTVLAVHRIDRDTSGLVVFARTPEAMRGLGQQFRAHAVQRRYLAITRGRPPEGRIESRLVRDRGDGRRGSGTAEAGDRAVTHVRVLEDLGPCSLVECRLETGRTHQVRIHLGEAGAPLAGETVYDRPLHGAPWPDPSGSPRTALHAAELGFAHPETGEAMRWVSDWPEDLRRVIERLRVTSGGAVKRRAHEP